MFIIIIAFRDEMLKTTGADIDKILPPISRFGGGGRAEKKQGVIEKLLKFFGKYFGIVNQEMTSNPILTLEYQEAEKADETAEDYNG